MRRCVAGSSHAVGMAGLNGAGPRSLDFTDWGTRRGVWRPPGRVGRCRCATLHHRRERRRRPQTAGGRGLPRCLRPRACARGESLASRQAGGRARLRFRHHYLLRQLSTGPVGADENPGVCVLSGMNLLTAVAGALHDLSRWRSCLSCQTDRAGFRSSDNPFERGLSCPLWRTARPTASMACSSAFLRMDRAGVHR